MQFVDKSLQKIKPLLTIAIPTYNREVCLDLCLKRISEELDSLSEELRQTVVIYITDNASIDNTREVILQHQLMKAGAFVAVRSGENIGGERNVAQCYTAATTPYVWILGDDDVILPGKLRLVLDTLIQQEIDILYVNNYWFKESYLEKPKLSKSYGISMCVTALAFARRTNVMLTFISGLIVRTGIDTERFSGLVSGSNLPQLGWVLPLLRDGKRFAIIEDWVVAAKGSNSGGYVLVDVFGKNLQSIVNFILKDKPELVKVIESGTIVNFFPGLILEFRKGGGVFTDKNMAVGLKELFGDNLRYYIFLAPLLILPLFLSRYYYYFIRLLRLAIGSHLI
jgi:glycosyltransferase involved in cell wall biosynthesis